MASVNKILISGTVESDPKLNEFGQCKFKFKNIKKIGDEKEAITAVIIAVSGKNAEICAQSLKVGTRIYLEGRIRNKKKDTADGQAVYYTEIEVYEIEKI